MATLVQRITDLATSVASALKAQRGIQGFCSGMPAASERVGGAIAPYALNLNAANCVANARVSATASAVFIINLNGVQIGTITFATGATAGVYSFTTTAISAGDVVRVVAPATQDATLADIAFLMRP